MNPVFVSLCFRMHLLAAGNITEALIGPVSVSHGLAQAYCCLIVRSEAELGCSEADVHTVSSSS